MIPKSIIHFSKILRSFFIFLKNNFFSHWVINKTKLELIVINFILIINYDNVKTEIANKMRTLYGVLSLPSHKVPEEFLRIPDKNFLSMCVDYIPLLFCPFLYFILHHRLLPSVLWIRGFILHYKYTLL